MVLDCSNISCVLQKVGPTNGVPSYINSVFNKKVVIDMPQVLATFIQKYGLILMMYAFYIAPYMYLLVDFGAHFFWDTKYS